MKKILVRVGWFLLFILLLLLSGWFYKKTHQPAQHRTVFSSSLQCTISGHPCWEIVRLTFNETTPIEPSEEIKRAGNWQEKIKYENNSLEELGLSIVRHEQYRDGGSESYTLSNGVSLYMDGKLDSPNRWQTTLSFPDNRKFIFDEQGHLITETNAQ